MGNIERQTASSSLLEAIKKHDPDAWDRLVSLYTPLVSYWCRTTGGLSHEETADVLQSVFMAAFKGISSFKRQESSSFGAWLRTITRNKLRDKHRKSFGYADAVGGDAWQQKLEQLPSDNEPSLVASEQQVVFESAMEVLSEKFGATSRRAFWMVLLEGCSASDAAQALEISEAAVWQACYRIRRRLRRELAELYTELFPGSDMPGDGA